MLFNGKRCCNAFESGFAFFFDRRRLSVTVKTSCFTGVTAVHFAYLNLRIEKSSMAVVRGAKFYFQ